MSRKFISIPSNKEGTQAFKYKSCTILISHYEELGWHLSISHPTRLPKWEEIKTARYHLLPANINVAMLMPPEDSYVNLHKFCFHLFQVQEWELSNKAVINALER